MIDKVRKGRAIGGWHTGGRKRPPKPYARLTDAQLVEIIGLYLAGMNQSEISARYGCCQTTVSKIVCLRTQRAQRALATAFTDEAAA
jgi:hypothetical protein